MAGKHLALVYWVDACHYDKLIDVEEARCMQPLRCVDVGFILENSKDKVVLASTIDEDDQVKYVNVIPRKYITKIRHIKLNGL